MKLVILGSPGAGKGTQTKFLSKYYNIVHISTGDLLRFEMLNKTNVGIEIEEAMNLGQLVSDEIVIALLKQRLEKEDCKNGFILDGFPRNFNQAKMLEDITGAIDKVIYVDVTDDVILGRMSKRVICTSCNAIFNVSSNPPKKENVCDFCSFSLTQREDDKPSSVLNRLKIFHNLTKPIVQFFEEKGLLLQIDGTLDIPSINNMLISALGEKND